MAKRKSFEDILNSEFRWPVRGDMPFVVAADPLDNANIAVNEFSRLVLMMEGYKRAADLMVEEAEKDRRIRDFLVFPIIFNYRQFLELSLKYHIATYGRNVGIEANWKSHDLGELWATFINMIELYGTTDPDEADPTVGEIVMQFAKIDPGSYSYRYPVDRKGELIPVEYNDLHLPTLKDVISGVAGYFRSTDGYLSNH